MKPRLYPFWIIAILAVLYLHPVRNVFGGEILYEDDFTNLDPSWGTPGDILSVKDGKLILKPALNTTQSVLNQSNVFDDADIQVEVTLAEGDPIVSGVKVVGEVIEQFQDKKVIAFKYKRRKGYHRTVGHRRLLTRIKIEAIDQ